jgi:hypothetical protein
VRSGRSPGGLFLAVLLALLVPLLAAAPAAADDGAPHVVATDQLLIWDGDDEVFAVRWHLSAPVTRVDWLVATPGPAAPARIGDQTLRTVAAEAAPRRRWYVTHPWLLFDDAGEHAAAHLAAPTEPVGVVPAVDADMLDGTSAALEAAGAAGAPVDDVTRTWVEAAVARGWTVHHVTARTAAPTTLVGPVAVRFEAGRPFVPSSPLPRTGRTSLITVAPRVLAAEQPDLAAREAADDEGVADELAAGAEAGTPSELLAGTGAGRVPEPPFTVENARTLRVPVADLDGRVSPSGQWVVTALSGSTPGVEPATLVPQDGPTVDWRSQVGVWWPGWGPAALAVLVAGLVVALAAVATRRRRRAAAAVVTLPAQRPEDTRELDPVDDDDVMVDTRPDIHPVP